LRYGLTRLFLVVALPALMVGTSAILWHRRWLRIVPLGVLALGTGLVLMPGRDCDRSTLRERYVHCLRRYEGTPYFWGGETRIGIDCSGLVRRGLVDANVEQGLRTLNGRLIRTGLGLWWNDCSARAMAEEYQNRTRMLFQAPSINAIDPDRLQLGDLAVTSGGIHVLAYLGDNEWIEADPGLGKVIRVRVPSKDNPWFRMRVQVLRWRLLSVPAG
jgi:hypothetical protein